MDSLIKQVLGKYPQVKFKPGERFCWSPEEQTIYYQPRAGRIYYWKLLHELGHAVLGHKAYSSDIELVKLEAAAWSRAQALTRELSLKPIDDNYIQDCLDTYRDWLHKRSTCPHCGARSLQENPQQYRCFNCQLSWQVSSSRFCRTYRQVKRNSNQTATRHEAIFA